MLIGQMGKKLEENDYMCLKSRKWVNVSGIGEGFYLTNQNIQNQTQ